MWPRRPKRPKLSRTEYSSYLRGRVCGAGIGEEGEPHLYSDELVPLSIRVAWTIGVTAKRHAPILSAAQVERAVRDRLDLAAIVASVERDDDPGSSSPPPPVAPVPVVDEETARVELRRWIGDPLPQT